MEFILYLYIFLLSIFITSIILLKEVRRYLKAIDYKLEKLRARIAYNSTK